MKNFPIEHNNKTYWIARNNVVVCFVFTVINDKWHILANKRGSSSGECVNMWNVPCGYVDFDETFEQAAIREVYEETGVKINYARFINFNDVPDNDKQDIGFRYYSIIPTAQMLELSSDSESRGGEKDEVRDVKWIPISEINNYQWAFNHLELIRFVSNYLVLKN
jgi:ADP-ribose pyrophosphatase YjhB (NUDIX family)